MTKGNKYVVTTEGKAVFVLGRTSKAWTCLIFAPPSPHLDAVVEQVKELEVGSLRAGLGKGEGVANHPQPPALARGCLTQTGVLVVPAFPMELFTANN